MFNRRTFSALSGALAALGLSRKADGKTEAKQIGRAHV